MYDWSSGEWLSVLVVIVPFLIFSNWVAVPTPHEKETLRSQFRLPPDVAIPKVRISRKERLAEPSPIEGIAQFSDAQLDAYMTTLSNPDVWRPRPIHYGGAAFEGVYSPDALRWTDLPGERQLGWGALSWKEAQPVRKGSLLCFVVHEVAGTDRRPSLRADACAAAERTTGRAVFVQGLIDFERRTLHMIVRGTRDPERPRPTS